MGIFRYNYELAMLDDSKKELTYLHVLNKEIYLNRNKNVN